MSIFEALARIELSSADQGRLGSRSASLELRRGSPRGADHLLVEYGAGDGRRIAGQWFRDPERCEAIAASTIAAALGTRRAADGGPAPCAVWTAPGAPRTKVLLQSKGTDRKMQALLSLVRRPGAELLVHHPERRAVVRLQTAEGPRFVKVVPSGRAGRLIANAQAVAAIAGAVVATPRLLAFDQEAGTTVWSPLAGRSLYDLLGSAHLADYARITGRALGVLHTALPVAGMARHSGVEEATLLQSWVARSAAFFPLLGARLAACLPAIQARLTGATTRYVVLHRDFYDKQVFIDGAAAGILDFETLALGEAALDLGNAMAHFELRALQGYCSAEQASAATAALLAGYQPDQSVRARLGAYLDAARLRLACVYAFRPGWQALVPALLERLQGSAREATDVMEGRA